ncbi:hypothetical protein CYMTET_53273, partial [Cymbomonas tetramitiformis]
STASSSNSPCHIRTPISRSRLMTVPLTSASDATQLSGMFPGIPPRSAPGHARNNEDVDFWDDRVRSISGDGAQSLKPSDELEWSTACHAGGAEIPSSPEAGSEENPWINHIIKPRVFDYSQAYRPTYRTHGVSSKHAPGKQAEASDDRTPSRDGTEVSRAVSMEMASPRGHGEHTEYMQMVKRLDMHSFEASRGGLKRRIAAEKTAANIDAQCCSWRRGAATARCNPALCMAVR